MELIAEWILPIKTCSELNKHEHWTVGHKRHFIQKKMVKIRYLQEGIKFAPGCHIILTRMSARLLDDDAVPGSLKWVRDAIADCIIPGLQAGRADDAKYGLTFEVKQQKAKAQAVKIQIYKEKPGI